MNTWAVLASGPSMSQQVADSVRGRCNVIAVSDVYKLAPWADIVCASDLAWWKANPQAKECGSERYCGITFDVPEGVQRFSGSLSGSNSGLLGVKLAHHMGAQRIILLGFDMGGSHFFGPHVAPLKNTSPDRFEVFKKQFAAFQPRHIEIINCTEASRLECYPKRSLDACLPVSPIYSA